MALFALLCLLLLCLTLSSEPVAASALTAEEEAAIEQLQEEVQKLLEALDTEELEAYLATLPQYEGSDLKEMLASIVTGDFSLDYSSLWQSVLALVWEEGKVMLPAFAVILAVTLLCGILNSAKNGFLKSTMTDIIHFAAYLSVGAVLLSVLISVLQAGFSAIGSMQRQMQIIYPILLTLIAASGGAVSAGIYRPAVAFLSSAVCEMFTAVVLPTSVVVIVLTFVGSLSDEVKTSKLGDFFKSINKWLIGLALGILGIFLTVQGITAAQYDGISLRAAKYLVSGSVPIVGGFLSGGLDLVLAGSALIKNAVGSFAVFLLFGAILRPVLLFAAFQLFLRLSAAVAEPVGGRISAFLSRLASDCGFFLAGLCCIAFLYFLTLILLVCSTGVIF
ncbi:MAG TPA: stage III sporulation protein AE [Candidatus Gallimonas intestinigallinarum]|uniref:Stage III sporulation protein AE n=1 Tax=Candidatus Gallimonas intestinigallinarum TaxID=2838604 RepID=A0A9D2DXZ0_9FIRM|nr:stage III sporulation protein AE [Candidatus Gallimonas intestinigallinarum]